MKTLLALFNEQRSQIQDEIDKATTVEQVVTLLQKRLDNFEKSYIGQLNISQVRLASFFLDALRQSIATLAATKLSQIKVENSPTITNIIEKLPSNQYILKLLQVLICIGILGSLFSLSKIPPGAWMAILLTFVLVGLEIVLQLEKNNNTINNNLKQIVKVSQQSLEINSQIILDHLADTLATIDQAVTSLERNKKGDELGLEELPELLSFLQKLMGASFLEHPQMAFELMQLLPQILRQQGIYAQIYRPNDPQSDATNFDFEPNIDFSAKDYITLSPALLKGDRLIRRGRVIEPQKLTITNN